jgi:hypothetical protein
MALVFYLLYDGFLLGLFFSAEDGGDMLLQNICRLPMDYSALYPRRQNSFFRILCLKLTEVMWLSLTGNPR